MAKRKRIKKRIKRQLRFRLKQTAAIPITPPKEFKAHILYLGKYTKENQTYQARLDKVYGGKVRPTERFINQTAIILHHCSECDQRFYGRPKWLLSKENQRHGCYSYSIPTGVTKKSQRIVSDEDILKMCTLFDKGISTTKIAIELGVSRPTVNKYLKQAGVK